MKKQVSESLIIMKIYISLECHKKHYSFYCPYLFTCLPCVIHDWILACNIRDYIDSRSRTQLNIFDDKTNHSAVKQRNTLQIYLYNMKIGIAYGRASPSNIMPSFRVYTYILHFIL